MPSLSGLLMCRTISTRTFVAFVERDKFFIGQILLGEIASDFKLSCKVFLVIIATTSPGL